MHFITDPTIKERVFIFVFLSYRIKIVEIKYSVTTGDKFLTCVSFTLSCFCFPFRQVSCVLILTSIVELLNNSLVNSLQRATMNAELFACHSQSYSSEYAGRISTSR